MPTLEDVLELVRDAREHIEFAQVNDAARLLETIEDDLEGLCAPAAAYLRARAA